MKSVIKFVMTSVAIGLFAMSSVAATTTTKQITVTCQHPTPDRKTGLIRYKGDTNQWVFQLALGGDAHLKGKADWAYPGKGNINSDWGLWAYGDTDKHMSLAWSSPNTTGKFKVTVSGKITCGDGRGGGNGQAETIDFITGWDGVLTAITDVTVDNGATKTNMKQDYPDTGDQNWGCVKAVGSHVEVKATTGPNDDKAEWDEISWNGGEQVPGKTNNYRWYTRDAPKKVDVEPTINGKGPKPLYIWVIWGTYTTHIDKKLDRYQLCEDQTDPYVENGRWSLTRGVGGGKTLGPIDNCHNPNLTLDHAVGRYQGIAKLEPSGIGEVVQSGELAMIRRATTKGYSNGLPYNGSSLPDRDNVPDISHSSAVDLTPSSQFFQDEGKDHLYDVDVPAAIDPYSTIEHTVEEYDNFTAWAQVTLDKPYICTNDVEYSYRARIDMDKANGNCAQIDLNQLSLAHIALPTSPFYAHR